MFNLMSNQVLFILVITLGVWLLGLNFVLYKLFKLFARLTKGVSEDLADKGFAEVRKRLDHLEKDGKNHVQKVALVRFNPFKELGGDHSFSLAILDAGGSGVIITSLHARERTRIYMKTVNKGKAENELSGEEKRVLGMAQKK